MTRAIKWQTQLTIANTAITTSYQLVGTLATVGRSLFINNLTNSDLQLSFDGINDHLPTAARSGEVADIMTNSKPGNTGDDGAVQSNLTTIWVKVITAGTPSPAGSLYISYWCEKGE